MKLAVAVVMGLFISQAAMANSVCEISVPSVKGSNNYDKTLITFEIPGGLQQYRRAVVMKDLSSAREMPQEEIDRRVAENDFGDLDGDFIVNFQPQDGFDFGITTVKIDAKLKSEQWEPYFSYGSIERSPLILFNVKNQVWSSCRLPSPEKK